jgi:hypothetical protein
MKYVAWLLAGIGLGFIVAHQVSRTPAGKALFENLDATTREITDAVKEGFAQRTAELRDTAL